MNLKKRIMLVVSMAVMTLSLFLSDMQVHAANSYYLEYAEPSTSDKQGYCVVEVLLKSTGVRYVNTFFWFISCQLVDYSNNTPPDEYDQSCYMNLSVDSNKIIFSPSANLTGQHYRFALSNYTGVGNLRMRVSASNFNSYTYDFGSEGFEITGITYKGNVGNCSTAFLNSTVPPVAIFNSTANALQLKEIYETLVSINAMVGGRLDSIITRLQTLITNTDTLETTLNNVYSLLYSELPTILYTLEQMALDVEEMRSYVALYFPKYSGDLTEINSELDVLRYVLEQINLDIEEMRQYIAMYFPKYSGDLTDIKSMLTTIITQGNADKNTTDGFKQDSDSQSNELDELNGQAQPDKIDVDNASGVVDQNLNINTDANYGVLLSTFTSNGKILTMLLAVSSIGLISYVLFGKR